MDLKALLLQAICNSLPFKWLPYAVSSVSFALASG
jgi:hypothetical protein